MLSAFPGCLSCIRYLCLSTSLVWLKVPKQVSLFFAIAAGTWSNKLQEIRPHYQWQDLFWTNCSLNTLLFSLLHRSVIISKHQVQHLIKNKRDLTERKLLYRSLLSLFSKCWKYGSKSPSKEHVDCTIYKCVLNSRFPLHFVNHNHSVNKINNCWREPRERDRLRKCVWLNTLFIYHLNYIYALMYTSPLCKSQFLHILFLFMCY